MDTLFTDAAASTSATFTPLAALSGTITLEHDYADLFWKRLEWFGAHEDLEIRRSWALIQENRDGAEAAFLWGLLGQYGATEDHVLIDIWANLRP